MVLSSAQRQVLKDWMRSKEINRCPACASNRWRFAEAAYVRALLEEGEQDLAEDRGVVKISCDHCGCVLLFDAEHLGIRGLWSEGRGW